MQRKIILFLLLCFLAGCGVARKKTSYGQPRKVTVEADGKKEPAPDHPGMGDVDGAESDSGKADRIISTALTYTGVRYKYGGTSRKGLDCSGLLYLAFGKNDVPLPRVSYQMAEEGRAIQVDKVVKGDLLFFRTSKKGRKINHVGLVIAVDGDEIKFIHSTTSRGVIVSSLREGYWNYAFVKATRIL